MLKQMCSIAHVLYEQIYYIMLKNNEDDHDVDIF